MISAGRVLLMPKGDYDPNATYELLDIVSYNGSSYIAKGTTTGNLPTNTTYWQLSAYGGQASNIAGNFAPLETTEYATRAYTAGDIFVDKDSQLVTATATINIGDEIEIGSNCDPTTIAELLDAIENRYDALDQRNRKLVGINPITIQTDLHQLAPGEYFKKLTTFYVTNAPTGINQVPTAVFRLTVESGLDESGSSLLLTLRTVEGEIYTQAYDGSDWSDWKKTGDIADVPTYTGATSVASGVKGLVPAATASERNNYFKGDGTWGELGTAAAKDSTDTLSAGSTDLIESGAVHSAIQTLTNEVNGKVSTSNIANNLTTTESGKVLDARQGKALNDKIKNKVLYLTEVACSATTGTGNFVSYSNSAITADHVVAECVFANPSAITADRWTTANGSLVINGTCSAATTVDVMLIKKDN